MKKRTEQFQENTELSQLIQALSSYVAPLQSNTIHASWSQQWPFLFVVGAPRSGTTLMMQWLASSTIFSYPTNLLTRFAYAPYLGAMVQQMLCNPIYDYQGELFDLQSPHVFDSVLGKTKGALAVNEFQHFFRQYLPKTSTNWLDTKALKHVNFDAIQKGLLSLEQVFQKPFVTKAMLLAYNIDSLAQYIPNSLFIYVKRDPIYTMQSLWYARETYFNDVSEWWSLKPKEYETLQRKTVYEQIAGQVFYTNKAIISQLTELPSTQYTEVSYESFCKNPEAYDTAIKNMYQSHAVSFPEIYAGPKQFTCKNILTLPEEVITKLREAYHQFEIYDRQ